MAFIALESTTTDVRWTADGRAVRAAPCLARVLEQLHEPCAVVCDPALFDGLRDVRRSLEGLLAEDGHTLVPITARARALLERAGGSAIRGRGVVRLYALATSGSDGLDRGALQGADLWDIRDALEVALAADLWGNPIRASIRALEATGPFLGQEVAVQQALGERGDFHRDVLLAVYRAASMSTGRQMYERLLGLNAGAHGLLTDIIRVWYAMRNTGTAFERESVMTWSDYRRALRALYHRVKEAESVSAIAAA